MADVHFKKHLIHRCMIQRRTDVQNSSGELIPTWADVGDVNCRFVQKQERIADPSTGFPMIKEDMLLMDTGEDVIEEDRAVDIIFRSDSSSVDAGPFTIESLLGRNSTRRHHLSLKLERVE